MAHTHVIRIQSRNIGKTAKITLITGNGPTKPSTGNYLFCSSNPKSSITPPTMPDPILALANFAKAARFTLAGKPGRVIPQLLQAGSSHHHSKFFYVEYPAEGGPCYQIDAARLIAVIGDGGSRRHFAAPEVATLLGALAASLDHHQLLKAVSL